VIEELRLKSSRYYAKAQRSYHALCGVPRDQDGLTAASERKRKRLSDEGCREFDVDATASLSAVTRLTSAKKNIQQVQAELLDLHSALTLNQSATRCATGSSPRKRHCRSTISNGESTVSQLQELEDEVRELNVLILLQNEAIVQLQDDVSSLRATEGQCGAEDSDLQELCSDTEPTVVDNYSSMFDEVQQIADPNSETWESQPRIGRDNNELWKLVGKCWGWDLVQPCYNPPAMDHLLRFSPWAVIQSLTASAILMWVLETDSSLEPQSESVIKFWQGSRY
jgi:hypothetical protein